jgi:serine/alanine adding enzyme
MAEVTVRVWEPHEFHSEWFAAPRNLFPAESTFASRWLQVLRTGLQHCPYAVVAKRGEALVGLLPLALVKSFLFGRYLVSLPYINAAGVVAESPEVAEQLITAAAELADRLQVRYLELRQEREMQHARLTQTNASKVLMRMALPATVEELWNGFKSKLRSQIKSGQKNDFTVAWGGVELLPEFYAVFSHNMRDLGTPVYSARLFAAILEAFPGAAELCVLRLKNQAVAGALLIHYPTMTEVPSASALRAFNATNANMVMYWHLLSRAVERGQTMFDFGRSTQEGSTYKFKQQWGAAPHPSVWQYYLRHGSIGDLRPGNAKFSLAIRVWQRLPVPLTRLIGPMIVRGIP